MYEIWITEAEGRRPGPRFRSFVDALRHVRAQEQPGCLSILGPDGTVRHFRRRPTSDERRRWPRVRLARRGTLVVVADGRETSCDAIIQDGSLGGLRGRCVGPALALRPGSRVRCGVTLVSEVLWLQMRVAWIRGKHVGLQLTDGVGRAHVSRWLKNDACVDTVRLGPL